VLGFIIGLAIGLGLLASYRRRDDAKLKRLLSRLEDRQPLPAMGYDAQIASAIAEQQVHTEHLDEKLRDLRQVLQSAPIGYLQVDEESRLLWCNQRAQDYLDIEQGDYAQPRLLLAIVRSYELDQLVERTRQTQQMCEARWTFNSISTDPLNYLERPAYPLQGYGMPISNGHVGIFLENRQEAVSLAQQRDRWISDVAHELKTPLTSIRLVAETLQSRIDPSLLSWIERLLKEVIRLSKLVDDVLNISRLEQGRSRLANEDQVNLVLLVQSVWHSIEPLAKLRQLELSYQGPEQLIANVNASLMHRVLFNLLSNAVKYSPPHQVIQVKLSVTASQKALNGNTAEGTIIDPVLAEGLSGECILLEVIDAGTGLNEQDLPYVFDRFYRADPARSHEVSLDMPDSASVNSIEMAELSSSGTGLGLAIVRQIVASHQGRVEAKNSPDTGGAWLRVWLPGKRLVKTMV
jgi:two-component system, OmpR family, phosphate regulon sensor histidine kinase PhoR